MNETPEENTQPETQEPVVEETQEPVAQAPITPEIVNKETPAEGAEVIGRGKRTFVQYREAPEGIFTEVARFRGSGPGNAAMKAASRGEELIILRETKKRKFRFYTGSRVDQMLIGPRAKWQEALAIEKGDFLKTTDGTLPAEYKDWVHDPDGILIESDPDYLDNPLLNGKVPLYTAKVGNAVYVKTEKMPKEMKLS